MVWLIHILEEKSAFWAFVMSNDACLQKDSCGGWH